MDNPKDIKTVHTVSCPHCKKDFFLAIKSIFPAIMWAHTKQELDEEKKTLFSLLTPDKISGVENYKEILTWLKEEETLLGPEEREELLQQLSSTDLK